MAGLAKRAGQSISIHAPRTGSDETRRNVTDISEYFNPRSPHGERLPNFSSIWSTIGISIHAPRTGSDADRILSNMRQIISIHAPRTGSDLMVVQPPAGTSTFQSTLPARGATRAKKEKQIAAYISIHAPRTGSDSAWAIAYRAGMHFNPRSPHGERRHAGK